MPSGLRPGLRPPQMTALTEQALGVALARRIDLLDEGRRVASDTIGYTPTGSGNEIDLDHPSWAIPTPLVALMLE